LDGNLSRLTVVNGGVDRVELGNTSGGYGIIIRDASGNTILSTTGGVPTSALDGTFSFNNLDTLPSWITNNRINSDGSFDWPNIIGSTRPDDNATKSRIFRQPGAPSNPTTNDVWYDTDVSLAYRWSGSAWQRIGNDYTNTNQLTDGAQLGLTANWGNVSGTGRPADNATVGAQAGVNLTDQTGAAVGTLGNFARLVGSLTSANISTYIEGAAIGTALIQNAAITNALIQNLAVDNAKIADVEAGKITAGTIDVNVNVGSANISLDGVNNRILISD
jgi:hypothetical protein